MKRAPGVSISSMVFTLCHFLRFTGLNTCAIERNAWQARANGFTIPL
nr:MAG TPA: hypothetical protein [Caudoviricetes sp.]